MFSAPHHRVRRWLERWLFQWRGAEAGEVFLNQRRVFVLPSQAGTGFMLLLLILLIAAVNYSLSLGFALTFLLAACGVVDICLTFRNLAHLHLAPGRATPVFAGEEARFELQLINRHQYDRYALWLGFIGDASKQQTPALAHAIDVAAHSSQAVTLSMPASSRGWLPAPRVRLQTRFPLGLVRAWSYWQPAVAVLVYPLPEANAPPLPQTGTGREDGQGTAGHDDFSGVRGYRPGDSPKHLAWRQIARVDLALGGTLVTKQFDGGVASDLCLDFAALPPLLETELKLSRLTRWILEAEAQGLAYEFRLDQIVYPNASGAAHQRACLRALALYQGQPG